MKYLFTLSILISLSTFISGQVTVQIASTNVNCFGGSNGTAQATATGGTAPYSFIWNNGETSSAITGLPIGTYTVTATDNVGATASRTLNITQPPLLGATLNGQPQICMVAPDGFSYAIPTGGTPPCSYVWSNNVNTQLNNLLTANTYTVTVTDTKGCTATGTYTVGLLGLGLYLFTDSEAATCPQPDNGSAMVSALSGNGPYQYSWSTGATTATIENVSAGDYVVSVSDVNGCSATTTVSVLREDVDPVAVQVLIPHCTEQIYTFESTAGYDLYQWSLSDTRDSIWPGDAYNQISVKWGAAGAKDLIVSMSDTITQCATAMVFQVTVNVCAVGASEPVQEDWKISPNPFGQFINIQSVATEFAHTEARLFNLQGELVKSETLQVGSSLLDTGTLAPGVYFLRIDNGYAGFTQKLVKQED